MRLTIIPLDKIISIDGQFVLDVKQDLSWIPSNVHSVQWYDTWGEVEYNDGTVNEKIKNLGIYEQSIIDYQNEIQRIQHEIDIFEKSRDYWEELRQIRNYKLSESDWTQVLDSPLTEKQKMEWQNYRKILRDLPDNIEDPKPLVIDPSHSDWPSFSNIGR